MKPQPPFHNIASWRDYVQNLPQEQKSHGAKKTAIAQDCQMREGNLTKPPGALGTLEELTSWFHQTRGYYDKDFNPRSFKASLLIFAGNHGIARHGVSAFPATITQAMVDNFGKGGAAANQLADWAGVAVETIALQSLRPTHDFTKGFAMDEKTFCEAWNIGFTAVKKNTDMVIGGEMGIGNSTAAAALCASLLGGDIKTWVGRGTGIDDEQLLKKQNIIKQGLAQYQNQKTIAGRDDSLLMLQFFGGFEMVALAGAMVAATVHHIPMLLDSYVTLASFAALYFFLPDDDLWSGIRASHCPAMKKEIYDGHRLLLGKVKKTPLVDLSLRLGEGTAGLIAYNLIRAGLFCHHGMASFDDLAQ